jgi:DNA replication protein DnaC
MKKPNHPDPVLLGQLQSLRLDHIAAQAWELAAQAAGAGWSHMDYLARLVEGQCHLRNDRAVARRIKSAKFPVIKTLEGFDWSWPKKINRAQIEHLFGLGFLKQNANVCFVGNVGCGKSHLATALGYHACLQGLSVLFTNTIAAINTLNAAVDTGCFKSAMKRYLRPALVVLDEVGYLPIDQRGADLFFQIISQRYESGSIILTTNRTFKDWPAIFNNDTTITSAVLDRLLHHAETVIIEADSYRMKDKIEP